jgi:hypothetical protein
MSVKADMRESLCDGKYTIVHYDNNTMEILRYGEKWQDVTGSGIWYAVLCELTEFRKLVVQPWLSELTMKQQTVLLTSFRGCDGIRKDDYGKKFTRLMRATVLKNADVETTFFPDTEYIAANELDEFFTNMDHYPVHWFMHLLHAAEICGYKHPDKQTRLFWMRFYLRGTEELHVGMETEERLDSRLSDKFDGTGTW